MPGVKLEGMVTDTVTGGDAWVAEGLLTAMTRLAPWYTPVTAEHGVPAEPEVEPVIVISNVVPAQPLLGLRVIWAFATNTDSTNNKGNSLFTVYTVYSYANIF